MCEFKAGFKHKVQKPSPNVWGIVWLSSVAKWQRRLPPLNLLGQRLAKTLAWFLQRFSSQRCTTSSPIATPCNC